MSRPEMSVLPTSVAAGAAGMGSVRPGERVLLRAFAALRWAGVIPVLLVIGVRRETLDRAWLAAAVTVAVVAFTLWTTGVLRSQPGRLMTPSACYLEVGLAAGLLAADGWVLGWEHTFDPPALGALWPLAAVMTAGLVFGPRRGALAGGIVAASRLAGMAAPEVRHGPPSISEILLVDRPRLIPILSLLALYAVAGLGSGYLAGLQRKAEDEIASARARDEVARTLHDGVLQTLAIIQRRATDPVLSRLARDTDRDLRRFLDGTTERRQTQLGDALRDTCDHFAHRFDLTPQLLVDDVPSHMDPTVVEVLAAAATEALTNVGKHAGANRVVVYAGPNEPGGGVLVTVNDDGCGFDMANIRPGRGFAQSIQARVEEIDGRVDLRSAPGQGTEVRLWIP